MQVHSAPCMAPLFAAPCHQIVRRLLRRLANSPPRRIVTRAAASLACPLIAAAALTPVAGQEVPVSESAAPATQANLMVLQSGRVVEGLISHAAGGYLVEIDTGSMFIPFEQVRFQAENLGDAYRKLRRSMPDLTANNHIALARWCMSHHQYHAARTELQDALALEPERDEARELLVRLNRLTQSISEPRPSLPAERQRDDEGYIPGDTTALAGLSREIARHYVTRIQPLLLNKCGNTRCHDRRHSGEFRLLRRSGPSRVLAERNLASVLSQIDMQAPDTSPLLNVPMGNHAARGGTVFVGPTGVAQWENLRNWVRAVAAEQRQHAPTVPGQVVLAEHTKTTTRERTAENDPVRLAASRTTPTAQVPAARMPGPADRPGQPDPDFVDQILQEEQPDAFDPQEFNRRFATTDTDAAATENSPAAPNTINAVGAP